MLFEGEESFSEDVNAVWTALHDTDLLTRAIPGCKSMTATGTNQYAVALSLGVAAVKGDYEGKVKVTDVKAPVHYVIEGEGAGSPGFVKLSMDCRLEPQGLGTLMKWRCDATVGGLIASVGGKVLSGISKYMAKQFFGAFKAEMGKSVPGATGAAIRGSPQRGGSPTAGLRSQGEPESWLARFWSSIWRRFSRS